MQVANGQLTILNPHTNTPQVFWNGTYVPGVQAISVTNDSDSTRVVLTLPEDPLLAEMKAAGIVIKREAT